MAAGTAMPEGPYDAVIAAPFGAVGIRVRGEVVCDIAFLPADTPSLEPTVDVAARACAAIHSYVEDPLQSIDIPLAIDGSDFQKRVWAAIARIPNGQTRTYGDLAAELGSTARAVGQACGDNRLPLAIPCHRVVAASGTGGFAHHATGTMIDVKRWLLTHESRPLFALTP